jgi:hypothetical protein
MTPELTCGESNRGEREALAILRSPVWCSVRYVSRTPDQRIGDGGREYQLDLPHGGIAGDKRNRGRSHRGLAGPESGRFAAGTMRERNSEASEWSH